MPGRRRGWIIEGMERSDPQAETGQEAPTVIGPRSLARLVSQVATMLRRRAARARHG